MPLELRHEGKPLVTVQAIVLVIHEMRLDMGANVCSAGVEFVATRIETFPMPLVRATRCFDVRTKFVRRGKGLPSAI